MKVRILKIVSEDFGFPLNIEMICIKLASLEADMDL